MSYDIKKSTALKYFIKEQVIDLSLRNLPASGVSNINKCITEAVDFVMVPLRKKPSEILFLVNKNNLVLSEKNAESLGEKIKQFERFLKTNILYSLVVKKHKFVIVGKSSSGIAIGNSLSKAVEDSLIDSAYVLISNDLFMQIGKEQLFIRTPQGNYINSLY